MLDLAGGVIMPAESEDAEAFVARCRPTSLGAGGSLGAVAPNFSRSPRADLVAVAKEWSTAWDGKPSMLEFGAARGLTMGAWELSGIAHADADSLWRAMVIGLTQQQLGSYLAMTAPSPTAELRVGTDNWQDQADVERVLSSLRAMGFSGPCSYTVRTYQRRGNDCAVGDVAVWTAAARAVKATRYGAVLPPSTLDSVSGTSTPPRHRTGQKQKQKPTTVKGVEVVSDDMAWQARREKNRAKRTARRRAARQRLRQEKQLAKQGHKANAKANAKAAKAKAHLQCKTHRKNDTRKARSRKKELRQLQQLPGQQLARGPLASVDSDIMTMFNSLGL